MVSLPVPDPKDEHTGELTDDGGHHACCSSRDGVDSRCGNGLEKIYKTTAVRYGYMKHVGEFAVPDGMVFTCGSKVVIQTQRGIEVGEQISLSCHGCDRSVTRKQLKGYIEQSGADTYVLDNGRILREATVDDLAEDMRLRHTTAHMKRVAQRRAETLGLTMKVVECEYLLGGDRAIFYFMADGRVDFRALVKDLSREFQTRIKMHQVGARDEARLLADYETCGRQVCCKVFLKTLKPISMRMAKLQRATLDPSKVSGRCGRLKCCLRYEHESYESLDAKLPRIGEKIKTAHGYGTVVNRQVLTQLVQVRSATGTTLTTVVIEDVTQRNLKEFPAVDTAPEPEKRRTRPAQKGRSPRESSTRAPHQNRAADVRRDASREPSQPLADDGGLIGKPQDTPGAKPKRRRRNRRRRQRPGGSGGNDSRSQRDGPTET